MLQKNKLTRLKQRAAQKIERQKKDAVVLSTRRARIKGADAKEKGYKEKKEKQEEAAYLAMMKDPVKLAAHLKKLTKKWMVAEVKMSSLRASQDSAALDKVLISYRLSTDQDEAEGLLSKGKLMFNKRRKRMKLYGRAKNKVTTYRMQCATVMNQLESMARGNKIQGPLIRSQLQAAKKSQEAIRRVGSIALKFQQKGHAEKMAAMVKKEEAKINTPASPSKYDSPEQQKKDAAKVKAAKAKTAAAAEASDPLTQLSHMIGSFDQVAGVWGSSMIAPPPPPPETSSFGPNSKAAQQAVAGVKIAKQDYERDKAAQVAKEKASIIDGFANGPGSSTIAAGSTAGTHPTKPANPPPPPGPDAVQIKLDSDWKRLQKEDDEKKQEAKGKKQEAKGVSELSSDR